MELHELIEQYRGQFRSPSTCDCLSMILHYLGDDIHIEQIAGRYKTQRGAFRTIPKLTGYPSIDDYLKQHCEPVTPLFCRDGDIVIAQGHIAIIAGGYLFGVITNFDGFEQFGYKSFDITSLNTTGVYIFRKR
ncbi:hypothetical protein G4923_09310 [Aeromonas rivipollensis]|uniref:DUF6950 domain-containing protein n=1 Tax=Aeromonas rivipollensis TaxID=948519 RepID=A0AAW9Y8G5_9GAMM|nr:hypothetical protein [Aeromonas rivipollensis]NEX74816.1 hypothetical protein [Aeromonas rivipollensis]NEX88901.1 hypothetical protein [Aeromonas rivipollensis]NEY04640.1 hypothetical protein [Aeromonas rivipollensis]